MVSYHFPIDYLLDLDIFSFDRLLEVARYAKNTERREDFYVTNVAVNGDEAAFRALQDNLSNESPDAKEKRKVAEGMKKVEELFGGR